MYENDLACLYVYVRVCVMIISYILNMCSMGKGCVAYGICMYGRNVEYVLDIYGITI